MQEFIYQYSELFSIVMYIMPPVLLLVLLYLFKRKLICLAIPITVICDIIVWGDALSSSHGREITAVFLIPQIIIVTIISLLIWRKEQKKEDVS